MSSASVSSAAGDGLPAWLALPLSEGVTVIAAHIGTTGENGGEANFERLLAMFDDHPKLLTEISSLTQVNKLGYLSRALDREALHPRLLHGSDWPLQFMPLVSPWYQWPGIKAKALRAINRIDNAWDRDVALKEAMGMPPAILKTGGTLLAQ